MIEFLQTVLFIIKAVISEKRNEEGDNLSFKC